MADPYQTLGIGKSASASEIKSAYRRLAKKLHPDVNPGRKDIEHKFKEVTAAYDLLSDTEKRARYDRGEIDAAGNERGFSHRKGSPFGRTGGGFRRSSSGFGNDPLGSMGVDDFFAEFFGANADTKRHSGARYEDQRGEDVTYVLTVPFVGACLGEKRRVTLSNNKTIEVKIPAGTEDGHKLRLRGQGSPGAGGTGDAIIDIRVEPHAHFIRKEFDIYLEAPITIYEAVLGAEITVPTLDGQVSVKVPKGANSGTTLRLKGKGIPKSPHGQGDMLVKLKVALPDHIPEDLENFAEKAAKKHPYDPRKKIGW